MNKSYPIRVSIIVLTEKITYFHKHNLLDGRTKSVLVKKLHECSIDLFEGRGMDFVTLTNTLNECASKILSEVNKKNK